MSRELVRSIGSSTVDNLIAKLSPAAETFGVTLAAGAGKLKRGSVLAPISGTRYYTLMGASVSANTTQEFSGDGSTKNFTITDKPDSLVSVTVGGTPVVSGTDFTYTAATGVIAFGSAPVAGTNNIIATYAVSVSATSPSCILADDADASGDSPVTAVAYRSGNFNRAAVHCAVTGEGDEAVEYELTAADEDALRKYDIILTDMMD